MCIFQPNHCPQCACNSAHVEYDSRTGNYRITCSRCGRREGHESVLDVDGFYCGFRHEVGQGFGVLFFRYIGGHEFYSCCLNTPTQLVEAEAWLRDALRSETVDPETASLTKWDDEDRCIVVVLGERIDLLAGRIVRRSGVPGRCRALQSRRSQADQRTMR